MTEPKYIDLHCSQAKSNTDPLGILMGLLALDLTLNLLMWFLVVCNIQYVNFKRKRRFSVTAIEMTTFRTILALNFVFFENRRVVLVKTINGCCYWLHSILFYERKFNAIIALLNQLKGICVSFLSPYYAKGLRFVKPFQNVVSATVDTALLTISFFTQI
jgi:hypothetical protein